jgi:hypothetical protein
LTFSSQNNNDKLSSSTSSITTGGWLQPEELFPQTGEASEYHVLELKMKPWTLKVKCGDETADMEFSPILDCLEVIREVAEHFKLEKKYVEDYGLFCTGTQEWLQETSKLSNYNLHKIEVRH